jgi:hypothetical protein
MKFFRLLIATLAVGACSAGDETGTSVERRPATGEPGAGMGMGAGGSDVMAPGSTETPSGQFAGIDEPGAAKDCGSQAFNVQRLPVDVLLVLDRSGSMLDDVDGDEPEAGEQTKWDLTVPALNQVIQETDSGVAWGMKLFPEGTDNGACSATTINDVIHIPIAPANAGAVVGAINATTANGDGTPTGDAINAAVRYFATQPATNRRFIVLATDGEPSCSPAGEGQEDARPYAVEAVRSAVSAGIPVFVVGVATTKDTATEALNDMANAGGAPRPDPNPLATRYYLANTQAELVSALRVITGDIASCVFPLNSPPPVPNNIGVKVDGVLVPRDATRANGWEYVGNGLTEVEVHGDWCNQIQTAAANAVEVIYACEGVIIQ